MKIMTEKNKLVPLISICIPVYKNLFFIERLLRSLKNQSFKSFEIVITDDSPDNSIEKFFHAYEIEQPIFYFKNKKALGTPENWNEGIRRARGSWIKLMHDDDWLASDTSLQSFVEYINQDVSFIFSSYNKVLPDHSVVKCDSIASRKLKLLKNKPQILLAGNMIGPPSVVLCRKDKISMYDPRLKWLVDIECYMRALKEAGFVFINKPLVNIGMSDAQVTTTSFGVKEIELPEYIYILEKHGDYILHSIMVYDAYWRMLRNLNIRQDDLIIFERNGKGMQVIKSMVSWQRVFPGKWLRSGFVSKPFMLLHYLLHRPLI